MDLEATDNLKKLAEPPPQSALKSFEPGKPQPREKGPRILTYLEGWYVIERMNAIFGADGWRRGFVHNGLYESGRQEIQVKGRTRFDVFFLCEYEIAITGSSCAAEDVGFGSGMSYNSWGDAIESAAKEAVTDALKRCCRSLGNALGNCLYDKAWLKEHAPAQKTKAAPAGTQSTPNNDPF